MAISTQGIISDAIQDPVEQQSIVDTVAKPVEEIKPIEAVQPTGEVKAADIRPVTTQVDPEQETVESRLNRMTAAGSRYTDIAKKGAIRQAATRGLINTTMAGAAGEEAAIKAALPIAQQDVRPYTETRLTNQAALNEFLRNQQSAALNIDRDKISAELNERMATLESNLRENEIKLDIELKTEFEKTLQDERFSDESKLQIVDNMNSIIRDTQQQITEVGLSDRSAEQQSAAISMINKSRDAELAVYQDILGSFNDWEWSTEFTPVTPKYSPAASAGLSAAETPTGTVGGTQTRAPSYGGYYGLD